MISEPLRLIFRFIAFMLVQTLVLNHIPPLHRFISPYLYYLFILWLPFSVPRTWMLVWGFMTGFTLDMFTLTPGLHASACLWVAYLRYPLLMLLAPRETQELKSGGPGIASIGFGAYAFYVFMLTFIHHAWLVFLEWMTFGNALYFLGKVFFSTLVSLLLILITELLMRPTRKRRLGV